MKLLGKMEKRLKNIFKEEENKMNKLTKEINEAESIKDKSHLAEMLLIVVDNGLDKLDRNFKIHKYYDAYKKVLLARKDAAESIIRMKEKNSLGAVKAVFNAFKRLIGK